MKLIETTPIQILEYLKRSVYSDIHSGLWDYELWYYRNIEFSNVDKDVSDYAKHYMLDMESKAVGVCTVFHKSMYIQINALGLYDASICGVIENLSRTYKVPIRVSTLDENLATKITEYFRCSLQSDYSRFALETDRIPSYALKQKKMDKILNIKHINWRRAEVMLLSEYSSNQIILTSKFIDQCEFELSLWASKYEVYTWSIPVEESMQIKLARRLKFSKLYTEYFLDITDE